MTKFSKFASTCANFMVYFNIRIYFFYFTYPLFKTPNISLDINFSWFFLKKIFSHKTITVHSLLSFLGYINKNKKIKTNYKMNIVNTLANL